MRKYLLTFLTFGLMFILSGCEGMNIKKSLDGTVWVEQDGNVVCTFTFGDVSCSMKMEGRDGSSAQYYYSYEYDFPIAQMYPENSENAALKGIVSDSKTKMNIINLSTNKTIGTFIKR